ncbi:glycosaminoglycan xylosylkinase-like isoform x2 [Plakobranchus ocellatus]|uniref:Glycosaminoglycan xylosylkinase-like isoform x2 n=1 Tax=Plakobranchus ocellatus TaxID=259542 RepID=A0AAV3ZXL3_9GAST|nr:glycosaminoglycan xylosylkinase-like isoform x2 [Plakobranchus ocellatus]
MKLKWRLSFVAAALFIIVVSYKILEPELFKTRESDAVGGAGAGGLPEAGEEVIVHKDNEEDKFNNLGDEQRGQQDSEDIEDHADTDVVDDRKQDVPQQVDVDEVVLAMSQRFALNFSYPLKASPWQVAASWVTPRQIHPENAKELGSRVMVDDEASALVTMAPAPSYRDYIYRYNSVGWEL